MGHSSLVDCSGGQAMSSITTNCGQDANQSSHERLRDVRIPERCALLLGREEIDREHLESYARYKPGQSRSVVALNRPLARVHLAEGNPRAGGRSSQLRKPRETALRRPTRPAAAPPPSAREAVLLASRFCRRAIRCCRSVTLYFLVEQRRNHDDPGEHHKYGHEEPSRHTRAISAPAIVKTPHDRLPPRAQNPRQMSLVHLVPPRRERHGEF
jgi:hypothetical protein